MPERLHVHLARRSDRKELQDVDFGWPLVADGLAFIVVPTLLLGLQTVNAGSSDILWQSVALCGVFNVLCTGLGYAAGAAAGLDQDARRTLMIETGIHNFGLFVVIAGQVFQSPAMIRAGAPYLFWMLGTAPAVGVLQALNRRAASEAERHEQVD